MVSSTLRHVAKIEDMKFFECPVNVITRRTWQILALVNETTGGENSEIIHLPFPGTIMDQPSWYRESVQIVRTERNRHQREQMKNRGSHG